MATVKLDPAKGIQIPNLTTTERNAISSPETGAIIWNTTTSAINQYNGSAWEATDTNTQADITGKLNLSGGAMTGTITNFTSTGIDDNAAGALAITIDSNEQVTMGGTTLYPGQGNTATGQHFENTGTGYLSRTGGYALGLNRNTSDGTIINFARQGSSVGSIDASTSGISIKLGGTAAANALDDYEEGTWTPSLGASNYRQGTWSSASGFYTKVGNMVSLYFSIGGSGMYLNNATAYQYITGAPYAADMTSITTYSGSWSGDSVTKCVGGYIYLSSVAIYLHCPNSGWVTSGVNGIGCCITYRTAS